MSNVYNKKSYGLLHSSKAARALQKPQNIFGDDSESDDGEGGTSGTTDWMRKRLQTQAKPKKAALEDESIYQYDEVYDEMQEAKEKESVKYRNHTLEGKKPKYIANLLRSAEEREREKERRIEKKVEKERLAEGEEFKDKESFVTAAYREKMGEMERLQEEERAKDALDDLTEVTKQKDMSGFYRHLYRQTMGEEKGQKAPSNEGGRIKKINNKAKSSKTYRTQRDESSLESSSSASEDEEERRCMDLNDNDTNNDPLPAPLQTREEKVEEMRGKLKAEREKREKRKRRIEQGEESSSFSEDDEKKTEVRRRRRRRKSFDRSLKGQTSSPHKDSLVQKENKPKRDVWKKITVGKVFEDAVQRYFERKASRTQFPLL
uniref:Coiled-coil domain-containing protein 55 n=1 Tax=Caligus rogercresseyi TaxID=217165 RepID=C1BQM4_CALRO|nr:Coiled-coil domain-containing protein 55 [Caligus rogercresseyi]